MRDALLLKVPSPDVDHVAEVADPPILPDSEIVFPEHTACEGPALAVATSSMVITTLSLAGRHGPGGSLVVKVSVTVLAVISFGPGVYIAFASVLSLNVPSPEVDHVALVAALPKVPASVAVPSEQMVWAGPASTATEAFIVMTMLSLTDTHGPVGSFVVSVSVTVPAVTSPDPGV